MKRNMDNILTLIPARGGSKGVLQKNIKPLMGKPLIAHTIELALSCSFLGRVVVSTDNVEIAEISREYGAEVPFMRPPELAEDKTPMLPVMQHAIESIEDLYKRRVDTLVLLDPTNPLRKAEDIENALSMFRQDEACDAVISGCESHHSPFFNMVMIKDGYARIVIDGCEDIGRRQDCPPVFDLDTTVWIYSREAIIDIRRRIPPRTRLYYVPAERSLHIDTELDFTVADFLMNQPNRVDDV